MLNLKGVDVDSLVIEHIQVNQVPKVQRRAYRAQGQVNPHRSSACHTETILPDKEQVLPEPERRLHRRVRCPRRN